MYLFPRQRPRWLCPIWLPATKDCRQMGNTIIFYQSKILFQPKLLFSSIETIFQFLQSRRMKIYMIIVGTKGHMRWLFSPQVTNKECNRGYKAFWFGFQAGSWCIMPLRHPKRCLIENDKFLQKRAGELTIAQLYRNFG